MQVERTTVTMPPKQHLMLHTVADRESIVKRARRLARRTGGVIKWWNGDEEWYEFREVVDTAKPASGQYIWHADGERVLHRVEQHTRTAEGDIQVRKLESVYRKMEDV